MKSSDLNIQILGRGGIGTDPAGNINAAGVVWGFGSPLVMVTRFNGRRYLSNGYHRACAAKRAGATHIPCVSRDVTNVGDVGIKDKQTFDLTLLESADAPTVAHFAQGRPYNVTLRRMVRIIHVSWSDHVVPEE
jgi:hypothetical protein